MYNVKILNKIAKVGLDVLEARNYSISDSAENPDAILVRSSDMHSYEFNEALRCIARAGAGTNNIPIARCSEAGIVVFNTPGANANAVKELALCAMLLASRDIVGGINWVSTIADKGDEVPDLVEKGKSEFAGPELEGKTLGVIGLGAIGIKVANAAVHLGMQVYGYDPFISVDGAWSLSRNITHAMDLKTIYRNADYISIHVPLMSDTRGMIDKEAIDNMKQNVVVINLARGELVDDDAMLAALDCGKVAHYVTDFPNAKTVGATNVIALPHLAASTPESEDNCAIMAARQVKDYLETGNIKNSVNLPDAEMDVSGETRLAIIHRNIPNMIGNVLSAVSGKNYNVENMINKSKGEYAYTLVDVGARLDDSIANEIATMEGILRVRMIQHG